MPLLETGSGILYLLPVWLGDHGGVGDMPVVNMDVVRRVTLYFAEHEKTARHMLRRLVPDIDLPSLEIQRLDKDSDAATVSEYVRMIRAGRDAAIVSEAGMPGIADPGAELVRAAHRSGVRVVPLVGPSSVLLALAASGLNGQRFTFHGYLPREQPERQKSLRALENEVQRTGAAQLFIETPYRNEAVLSDLLRTCSGATLLCIACDITQPGEFIRTLQVAEWKKQVPALKDRPTVFILGS
ncbi:MAG: SAM-dependent methyltransferase [Flavobacteriales bacterium]